VPVQTLYYRCLNRHFNATSRVLLIRSVTLLSFRQQHTVPGEVIMTSHFIRPEDDGELGHNAMRGAVCQSPWLCLSVCGCMLLAERQSVEHGAYNANVFPGSIPAGATHMYYLCTLDCKSLWIKASAKWDILLITHYFLRGNQSEKLLRGTTGMSRLPPKLAPLPVGIVFVTLLDCGFHVCILRTVWSCVWAGRCALYVGVTIFWRRINHDILNPALCAWFQPTTPSIPWQGS
jgi:hypothetical protein